VRSYYGEGQKSITYSGGQATEGQGGFYGSGGARATGDEKTREEGRPEMLALAADVQKVRQVMKEVETLENLYENEMSDSKGQVTGRSIEIRSSIKKLMTSHEFLSCLTRLEVKGEPTWGLSSAERELIMDARRLVNEC